MVLDPPSNLFSTCLTRGYLPELLHAIEHLVFLR